MAKIRNGKNGDGRKRGYRPKVVVKFHDYVRLPYSADARQGLEEYAPQEWAELAEAFPGIDLEPLFTAVKPEQLQEMVERGMEMDRNYKPPNFFSYFAIECPPGVQPEELIKRLLSWAIVERAYVTSGPTPPPVVMASDDPRWTNQGYLDPAPDGIDAEYAWGFAGGDGAGIQFVDMEQGWTLSHEDLNALGISIITGVSNAYHGHGTAVLGEVAAVDNTLGCVGITPNLDSVGVVSEWDTATTWDRENAVLSGIAALTFGDVLLLEAQASKSGYGYLPVEVEDAVFELIRLGTALGIIVVEAGANGSEDLDVYTDAAGDQILNRASADFRDSGAIMVGAGSASVPHTRLGFSNYGSRIDCYGWGQSVDTTGDGWTGTSTTAYTSSFGGTSSASPIVAGAALALQGIAEATLGYRFSAWQMRAILGDPTSGTASDDPPVDRIGVMPDLRALIDNVLNLTPDVYLRDYVGDTGDPHSGAISASPDIILSQTAVMNPQASFGAGSGTENSNTLGFEAEAGQDNFIYVRALNRGGAAAANVEATVYWSPVATLLTPDLWTLVDAVTIPNLPAGNVLTVSNAITWPAGDIPATGHYCFVGLLGNTQDPAPSPADFLDWNNFQLFIRNNNNVTWRNFNVVDNVPAPGPGIPPGFVALPFLAPGTPDRARPFALEVVARLPEKAEAFLELPLYLLDAFGQRYPYMEIDKKREIAIVPLNPHGKNWLGEALFPAKARHELRLLVHIPEELREQAYEVYARQLFRQEEVGRVTWHLAPKRHEYKRKRKGRKGK